MSTIKLIVELIISRLPGGTAYNKLKTILKSKANDEKHKKILNIYKRVYLVNFFLGKIAFYTFRNILLRNQVDGSYNLSLIKIPAITKIVEFRTLLYEMGDLIIPYISNINPDFSSEGPYERFGINVNQGDIVFDVGANFGLFTAFCSNNKTTKMVFSFEPVKSTYNLLKKTIAINNIESKVTLVKKGLSDTAGSMPIFLKEDIGSSSIINNNFTNEETEMIDITTIDQFMKENNLDSVDFIKADIEGAERLMLKGAKETLKRFKPKLAICTYHLPDDIEVLTNLILDANPDYEIFYSNKKLFAK